jgi:hypothetical protein
LSRVLSLLSSRAILQSVFIVVAEPGENNEINEKQEQEAEVQETVPCTNIEDDSVQDDANVETKADVGGGDSVTERQDMVETASKSEDAKKEVVASQQKGRRTKSQMKQELHERKVQEKQRELRRQRTRNRKYMSDDFTSIFTENKDLLSSSGYVDDDKKEVVGESDYIQEEIVETGIGHSIEIAECVEVGSSSSSDDRSHRDGDSRPGSPYSEISNSTVYSISSDSEAESSVDEVPVKKPSTKADYKASRKSRDRSPEYHQPVAKRRRLSPQPRKNLPQSTDKLQRYSPHSSPRGRRDSPHSRSRDDSSHSAKQKEVDSPHGSAKKRREDAARVAPKLRDDLSYDDTSRSTKPRDELPRSGGVRMRQVGGCRTRHFYYDTVKLADNTTGVARSQLPDSPRETTRHRQEPLHGNKETKISSGKVSDNNELKQRLVRFN